jgi:hypothetical protein
MADLRNYSVARLTSANVNVPRWTISCTVVDSATGATLADFTGANALSFPGVLATLTATQRNDLMEALFTRIALIRAGEV